ncbi:hypothetical protein CDL15_Pgr018307 [Punica granatum]|uniref:Uncharacterized protein n=1 Tax=Punica granatum TaxID=22663 RepID=A0A218WK60_PUNGR|nr:hypothetical protein CDL15_Pgr018307 [Punica granatum]
MERNSLLICCGVVFFGLFSAATGFAAEATRIKGSSVQLVAPTQCAYPQSPALALGLTAAVALVIAQIIINVGIGCTYCNQSPHLSSSNWTIAVGCLVGSWFTFAVAFFLLLTAAAMNKRHGAFSTDFGSYYCYVVKPGVFAGGAALSIVSVTLGMLFTFAVAFFLLLTAAAMNKRHGAFSTDFGSYYCYVVKPGVFAGGAALSIVSVTLGMLYYLTLISPSDNDAAALHQEGITPGQSKLPIQRSQGPVFVHEDTYRRRQFA